MAMTDYVQKIDQSTQVDTGQVINIEDTKHALDIYLSKGAYNVLDIESIIDKFATKEDLNNAIERISSVISTTGITATVAVETGSTVTATKIDEEDVSVSAISADNQAVLRLPKTGTYSIQAELDGNVSNTVQLECSGNYPASNNYIKLNITVDSGSDVTVSKDSTSYTKKK